MTRQERLYEIFVFTSSAGLFIILLCKVVTIFPSISVTKKTPGMNLIDFAKAYLQVGRHYFCVGQLLHSMATLVDY